MFRLRTTAALSVFALIIGVAATAALSEQTSGWPGPSRHMARGGHKPAPAKAAVAAAPRQHKPTAHPTQRHAPLVLPPPVETRDVDVGAVTELIQLRPLSMPAGTTPYAQMFGHLDGQMLLELGVDGAGRVRTVAVRESSGDAVLDAHALRMVRGWRFAVPADHPAGIDGELPLRFDSGGPLARAP